jgi:undecaprenyl diphosphate synthase
VIGRRDRISPALRAAVEDAQRATAKGTRLNLRIALDYSSRDAILRAAQCLRPGAVPSRDSFGRLVAIVDHGLPVPEVDLLIRTGGERRLSDFLLWEAAYAELFFSPLMWPEFGPEALQDAVREFATRERRFGGLPDAAAG